jgi:hypothetical protein
MEENVFPYPVGDDVKRLRSHFDSLRNFIPHLKGYAIFDNLRRSIDNQQPGLVIKQWEVVICFQKNYLRGRVSANRPTIATYRGCDLLSKKLSSWTGFSKADIGMLASTLKNKQQCKN